MTKDNKQNSIIEWADRRPVWEKLIWYNILNDGELTSEDLEDAFLLFLIENGLEIVNEDLPRIEFDGLVPAESKTLEKVSIKEIRECENINAIPSDQILKFGDSLSLIYGINGAGKSGFGKLLANACFARGSRNILPNLKKKNDINLKQKAKFVLGNEDVIEYGNEDKTSNILKHFSVFDNKCVPIYLNNSNILHFTPGQLMIFDKVIEKINDLERRFFQEKQKRIITNPIENLFTGETQSSISRFFSNLNYTTEEEDIRKFSSFTESDSFELKSLIASVDKSNKLDIPRRKKQLQDETSILIQFKETLTNLLDLVSNDFISQLNNTINLYITKDKLVQEVGLKNFNSDLIKSIGSNKWKAFLITAKELYDFEISKNNGSLKNCLLCHQKLGENEISLFNAYWSFLESSAESELINSKKQLDNISTIVKGKQETFPIMDESNYAVKVIIDNNPKLIPLIESILLKYERYLKKILLSINDLKNLSTDSLFSYNLSFLNSLIIPRVKEQKSIVDPSEEIGRKRIRIIELKHRKKIVTFQSALITYIKYLKWVNRANQIRFPKNAYTIARRNIFNEIIAKDYSEIFNDESKKLNSLLGLGINTRGSEGDTVLEISLDFAQGNKLTEVLSEGEQKVSAIADFLTEIQIDDNNFGIIFDDPVTSLDHNRKELIAKRLVEESTKRQVIIFTHDITFFLALQYYAEQLKIDIYNTTIRKIGDTPGIISEKLPWVAQNVKARKGVLKEMIVEIESLIKKNEEEHKLELQIKSWYGLLRESWERAVEERLLKGTVERFAPSIQTQRIKRIEITDELLNEIEIGMTESSKWVHDRASGLNTPIPDIKQMNIHFERFEEFIKSCKP